MDLLRKSGDGDARDKYKHIRIEGQRSNPIGSKFQVRFPRSEETRALIEALARFDIEGNRSWAFSGGEIHKRVVARWLRAHTPDVIAALQPPPDLPVGDAVAAAVELLALGAFVRDRRRLPEGPAQVASTIVTVQSPSWHQHCDGRRRIGKILAILPGLPVVLML
jgi:hypothetical protein